MPNIKSSKKRVLIIAKKNLENKSIRSEVSTAIKKFNAVIASGDMVAAEKLLPSTVSIIDSACAKGIIHKNNAARKKSALAIKIRDIKSGKVVIATPIEKKAKVKAEPKAEEVKTETAKPEVKKEKKAEKKVEKKAEKAEAKPEKKEKKAKKDAE